MCSWHSFRDGIHAIQMSTILRQRNSLFFSPLPLSLHSNLIETSGLMWSMRKTPKERERTRSVLETKSDMLINLHVRNVFCFAARWFVSCGFLQSIYLARIRSCLYPSALWCFWNWIYNNKSCTTQRSTLTSLFIILWKIPYVVNVYIYLCKRVQLFIS